MPDLTRPKLTFTATRQPVSRAEQARFQADLETLGLDDTVWLILNSSVEIGSKYSIPTVLRAYHNGALLGVAYFIECKRTGECFFDYPAAWFLNNPPIPIFFWSRCSVIVDHYNNPGFVTAGLSREEFFLQALAYLKKKYFFGVVLDHPDGLRGADYVVSPFVDIGFIHFDSPDLLDTYLARHKNLKKKQNKFRNKDGAVEIIHGALPDDMRAIASRCLALAEENAPAPIAFQDIYKELAVKSFGHNSPRLVHFVARLAGRMVGYHSFARSGDSLYCLSGAFDRNMPTTYHAYENIILESIRYGQAEGLRMIDYGPTLNSTKAKMMTHYRRYELCVYSRLAPIRLGFPHLVNRSKLSPTRLQPFMGLSNGNGAVGSA